MAIPFQFTLSEQGQKRRGVEVKLNFVVSVNLIKLKISLKSFMHKQRTPINETKSRADWLPPPSGWSTGLVCWTFDFFFANYVATQPEAAEIYFELCGFHSITLG